MPAAVFNKQQHTFVYISIVLFLICFSFFAYSGSFIWIALPFAYVFVNVMIANWKLAYYILLFTIPISTQIELMDGALGTSLPDEPVMWLFLLLFTLLFVSNPRGLLPKWWWSNPIVLVTIAQYIWLILAVCFATYHVFAVKFLMAKTWFLVSFFIFPVLIFKERKDFKKAFLVVLIPLLLTMAVIMVRHAMLGLGFRKIEKAIGDLYYNHVDYSTVMSMFFPLLYTAFITSKGKKFSFLSRLIISGLTVFFLVAIFFAFARAAMLAIIFAVVIAIAIRIRLVNFIMPLFYTFILSVVVFLANNNKYIDYRPDYERTFSQKTFEDLMVSTFRGGDMSSMERVYRWIASVRMSQDKPLIGYGPNAFYEYYKPYTVTAFRTYVSRNPERSTTHNYFLLMLVEQGVPAMLLYGLLVFVVFAQAQKTYHRFKDKFYKCVTLGVVMMFAAGFVNNFFSELIETHKVGALFYLSMAVLVILDKKSREDKENLPVL